MAKFDVVFATDQKYAQHLGVALYSLLRNNKEIEFDVYIINGGIDNKEFNKLEKIALKFKCKLINIEIDDGALASLVQNHHFTKANYYRLLIPEFIKNDKALYLDADIVINNSIKKLVNINLDGYYVAAVENPGFDRHQDLKMDIDSKYFNSGVMLINVKRWKEKDLQNQVLKFVEKNSTVIKFVDQCGLNAIINGNWKKIPLKFNQQAVIFEVEEFERKFDCYTNTELKEARENPVIIHYTGSSKPWSFQNKHPYKYLYWKYLRMTPYKWTIPEDLTILNILKRIIPNKIKEPLKNHIK